MDGHVARFPLELERRRDDLPVRLVALVREFEFLRLERFRQFRPRPVGDEFGERVHFEERRAVGASHVLHGGAGGERPEGADLDDPVLPVLLPHVFQHLVAPVIREVRVNIGEGDPFRVEETLEDESVLEGVEGRDVQTVRYDRSGGGTAAGSDGDAAPFRFIHEIGDDQEVPRESHVADNRKFMVQPFALFPLRARVARGESGQRELPQILRLLLPVGRGEGRDVIGVEVQCDGASVGDFPRVRERFRDVRERACELVRRAHGEIAVAQGEAACVVDERILLNAQENVVRFVVLRPAIVAVAGGDQGDSEFLPPVHKLLVDLRLPGHVRKIHELEVEIFPAEEGPIQLREFRDAPGVLQERRLRNGAADRSREGDETAPVPFEELVVHAGFVVHALERRVRRKLQEIQVSFLCFGDQDEREPLGVRPALPVVAGPGRDVCLESQDGFQGMLPRGLVELDEAVRVPLVGDAHGRLPEFLRPQDDLLRARERLEEGVGAVAMQMDEVGWLHGYGSVAHTSGVHLLALQLFCARGDKGTATGLRLHFPRAKKLQGSLVISCAYKSAASLHRSRRWCGSVSVRNAPVVYGKQSPVRTSFRTRSSSVLQGRKMQLCRRNQA